MAADLLIFYMQEFGYVALAADVTTGSSIMPQKRNPDVLELLRGASATAQACLDERPPSICRRGLSPRPWCLFRYGIS